MNRRFPLLLLLLLLLGLALPAAAQEVAAAAAERQRIKAERARAESAFAVEEKACYGKFAVNDCVDAAKAKRREVLADLRRQEISLNDADRKRKAADRLRELDEAQNRQARPPAPAKARTEPETRTPKAAPQRSAAPAEKGPEVSRTKPDTRENLRRYQARLEEAQERKGKVEQKAAERNKVAQPLPVPP